MISRAAGFCIWSSERLIAERFIKSQVAGVLPAGSTCEGSPPPAQPSELDAWHILCSSSRPSHLLFAAMVRAKIWSFGVARPHLGTSLHRHGDSHKLGMPGACCRLPQNHTMCCVLDVQCSLHGGPDRKEWNCFSCLEYTFNFVPCNIIEQK